ncbi:MAG: DUF4054 domain-containing protein [Oscillospiraceae bacterium]|nr:DUF4054 domain-containing protein [Oscillospiraceae bacterium]
MNGRGLASAAANILDGKNPPYTVEDFRAAMPGFTPDIAPDGIVEACVALADSVIKRRRWDAAWQEGMRLFIAHFLTLYAESTPGQGAGLAGVINAGTVKGNRTSKSVGDIAITYDMASIMDDLKGYGSWKLSAYGVQYITLAKAFNRGGMGVR